MVNVLQWNPSNTDTIPPLKCALIREVSSFQRCPLRGVPLCVLETPIIGQLYCHSCLRHSWQCR